MKKIFSSMLLLTFLITALFPTGAFAYESPDTTRTNDKKMVQKFNEYDLIKKLKSSDKKNLYIQGYTDLQVQEIAKLDYKKEIEKRGTLDTDVLGNMGYTDEQITIMKNFTGTEKELYLLSATLTLNCYYDTSNYAGATTTYKVNFDWNWSSEPYYEHKDIIGLGWTEQLYINISSSYHKVTYINPYVPTDTKLISYKFSTTLGNSTAESKFPMLISGSKPDESDAKYAKDGFGSVTLFRQSKVTMMAIKFKYGHTQSSIEPSLSIGIPFSVGVGFGFASHISDEATSPADGVYYYLK
ncbi:hypothetical protein [Clostridium sp. FP1]|uniref:hypothetical protein n=1 Tax=Clostridium sp. FP1 TaxID=2724076 RepID=UPI0013E9987F|nr:hypothetical protein [Clostridium sp. FP1]MBZ9637440.1 hypothetical protein [Clostridium sp. FP1]